MLASVTLKMLAGYGWGWLVMICLVMFAYSGWLVMVALNYSSHDRGRYDNNQ